MCTSKNNKALNSESVVLSRSHTEPGEIRHPVLLFSDVSHPEHPIILHVFHVPPIEPFVHLNPVDQLPRVQAIHILHASSDLWAPMSGIKEVPLASSAREPRVVKRRRVCFNSRLHRCRPALTLAAQASPRSEEREIELDDLNAVTIRDDLQERRPVNATAHPRGDVARGLIPP